jgi:hypothetical protein
MELSAGSAELPGASGSGNVGSYSLHTISMIVKDDQDTYHTQCPMK